MSAQLKYYIAEGVLRGFLNGRLIHVQARSSGGGTAQDSWITPSVGLTPQAQGTAQDAWINPSTGGGTAQDSWTNPSGAGTPGAGGTHSYGVPIPLGRYSIATPAQDPQLGLCARLTPDRAAPPGRGGFYIHSRGPLASDGIVPVGLAAFAALMTGLTTSLGGTLQVVEGAQDNWTP